MRILKLDNNQGEISVISSKINGVKGQADTFTDINIYFIESIKWKTNK